MRCPACQSDNDDAAEVCFHCRAVLAAVTLGTRISSRYRILAPLGRGGMGAVYRARDEVLDEEVALKILRPEVAGTPEMAARFRSEIKLARRVSHWNVCRIHEYGEDGPLQYISMELITGGTLKERLRAGPLPAGEACLFGIQMAEGLAAIHKVGIVHRDLKSANVMIAADGTAKVMDFGIAKPASTGTDGASTGYVLGSPEYMSPEQARGRRADFRSDIYSLGVVLFEAFTGRVPFRGATPVATLMMHVEAAPPIDDPGLHVPPALVGVLRRALAKAPEERFPDAAQLAAALRSARDGASPAAGGAAGVSVADTEVVHTRRLPMLPGWSNRSRHLLLAGAIAGVVLAAVIAGTLASRSSAPSTPAVPSPIATLASPITTLPSASPLSYTLVPDRSIPSPGGSATTAVSPRPSPTVAGTGAPVPGSPAPAAAPPTTVATAVPVAPAPSPTATAVAPAPATMDLPPPVASPLPPATTAAPTPPPSPAGGWLKVLARPWADVTVDGRLHFTTPMAPYALPPGPHAVLLTHPRYKPYTVRVEIRPGETATIDVDLAAPRR